MSMTKFKCMMAIHLLILVAVAGCQTSPGLMPTPNLYLQAAENPFDSVPEQLRSNRVEVIYGTDRLSEEIGEAGTHYGYGRSMSLAVGTSVVEFGTDTDWAGLVEASIKQRPKGEYTPHIVETTERLRYPDANLRLTMNGRESILREDVQEKEEQIRSELHALLSEKLSLSPNKVVYLFVHGYDNTFEDGVTTIAQIWHFLGRQGAPLAYSWPAGRGGLRGYTTDRESGEFTIFHLKQFIRDIVSSPDVERLDIIGHSRGTDVVLTAIRELYLEAKGTEQENRDLWKLGNLVLAAPDLDLEVVTQRVGAEGLMVLPDRFTVYLSEEDKAIGLATWLFSSVRRLGKLRQSDLSEQERQRLSEMRNLHLVDARVERNNFYGHDYFFRHPAVSSDLILILRYNRDPGAEHGRPLKRQSSNFWEIGDGYPKYSDEAPSPMIRNK